MSLCGLLAARMLVAQDIVWEESFTGYSNLTVSAGTWNTSAADTDDCGVNCGTNYWGVYNGAFRCNDIEGPGSNCQNYFTTSYFDISAYSRVSVSAIFWSTGALECPGNNASDDIIKFEYRLNNGPWTLFDVNGYTCGSISGTQTASSICLAGDSIALRVMVGNKANDENTYFDNLSIIGYDLHPINIPDNAVSCAGNPVVLTASGGSGYTWFLDGNLLCQGCDSVSFIPTVNNSWVTVEYTDSAGCPGVDSLQVGFAVMDIPSLPEQVTLCPGDSVFVEVLPGQSWLWSTGATTSFTQVNSSGLVWLEVTDSNGCYFRDTVMVALKNIASIDLGPDTTVCTDAPYFLFISNTFESYVWGTGNLILDTGTAVIAVDQSGEYWVYAEKDGCHATDSITLALQPNLSLDLGDDILVCDSSQEEWTLKPDIGKVKASSVTFFWQNGSKDSVFVAKQTGKYFVTVFNQCDTVRDTISLAFGITPEVALAPLIHMCPSDTLVLDPKVSDPDHFDFAWSDGSTGATLTVPEQGTYEVTVTSACGTDIGKTEVVLREGPVPVLEDLSFPCVGFMAELEVSGDYSSIQWSTGSNDSVIAVTDTGLYFVDITVCDSVFRDELRVSVSTDTETFMERLFPNVITPNGDRVNDEFRLMADPAPVSDFELSIYNRWGEKVFQTPDAHEVWDGAIGNGRSSVDGVYFYTATFIHQCMGRIESRGSVTILN